MGSICHIISNPQDWKILKTKKKLKPEYGAEELLEVFFGTIDDDPDGVSELSVYMRRSVYDKVMTGEYKVSEDSTWKRKLILVNKRGEKISPLSTRVY